MKKKKKPLLKRVWFWLFIIFVGVPITIGVIVGITSSDEEAIATEEPEESEAQVVEEPPKELTEEEKAALAAQQRREMIEKQFSAWDGSHIGLTRFIKKT